MSGRRESDSLPSPWEGDILPVNYARESIALFVPLEGTPAKSIALFVPLEGTPANATEL